MTECCLNCEHLWTIEDWTDYPNGHFIGEVCGAFADDKSVMALYGDLGDASSICECYVPRKGKNDAIN